MSLTFIDTNKLPAVHTEQGDVTEILNNDLAGAHNVNGQLRWLEDGQTYDAVQDSKFQLIYLMDGKAKITLEGKEYDVKKGNGVYLEPNETASIAADGKVKLFHLIVPIIPKT